MGCHAAALGTRIKAIFFRDWGLAMGRRPPPHFYEDFIFYIPIFFGGHPLTNRSKMLPHGSAQPGPSESTRCIQMNLDRRSRSVVFGGNVSTSFPPLGHIWRAVHFRRIFLTAAQGFVRLGMSLDANAEPDRIDPFAGVREIDARSHAPATREWLFAQLPA